MQSRTIMGLILAGSAAFGLTACGSGDSAPPAAIASTPPPASPPPPPPPPPTPPTSSIAFTPGVFEAASVFEDRCEVVRTGLDIEGNTFPDQPGSTLEEQFWLRSWTDETYLWPDEVVDRDPNDFATPVDYFQVLRTTETTPSGEDKDDFHFSQSTESFLESRTSTPSAGYGARFIGFSTTVPRDFRVQYTEPDSPASEIVLGVPNFQRGTRILEIDGVDLVNGGATQAEIDILNNGLFPATVGERHDFVVRDPGSSTTRTVSLVSGNIAPSPVNRTSIISTPSGNVGYILFNTFSPFSSEQAIAEAFSDLSDASVTDLVLDLRYNGGGLLAVAAQLSYMIAGDTRSAGRTFELLQFNGKSGNRNPVTGAVNEPIPFFDSGLGFSLVSGEPLDSLDLDRVFILSTESTCSASEAVINALNGIGVEVILIGDTTCGKPFGFYPTDNCGETYFTIQFQGVNDMGFGGYSDGFTPENSGNPFAVRQPGCLVEDDYSRELGDTEEALLSTALTYRDTGACPATTPSVTSSIRLRPDDLGLQDDGLEVQATDMTPLDDIRLNNRDMTMPF